MSEPGLFLGFVNDEGKLTLDWPTQFKAYAKHLAGEEVEVILRKRRSRRSLKANAYYWGVVLPAISQQLEGWTVEDVHEAMKAKFLAQENLELGLWKIGSSRKLTVQEFGAYLDSIILWAAEKLGVVIDAPPERQRVTPPQRHGRAA